MIKQYSSSFCSSNDLGYLSSGWIFFALLSSCTTHRAMQPTVTLYDQGFSPNICIKAGATSADVTLQNHITTVNETWV